MDKIITYQLIWHVIYGSCCKETSWKREVRSHENSQESSDGSSKRLWYYFETWKQIKYTRKFDDVQNFSTWHTVWKSLYAQLPTEKHKSADEI